MLGKRRWGCWLYSVATDVGVRDRGTSVLLVCANKAVNVVRGPRANILRSFGFRRLGSGVPRLGGLKCTISAVRFSPTVSSSRVKPRS